jgi:cytoskeletal protein RodZ
MKTTYLRDQRGVAMLLELVLVATVLALVGLAVYQSGQHNQAASVQPKSPAPQSTESLATSAATIANQESAADTTLANDAETSADELSQADSDVANLGGTSNASF